MLKNKAQIIIPGALAITILMHFQRVIMVFADREGFAAKIGVTIEALILRMLLFFVYACLLLSFNIIWKDKWHPPRLGRKAFHIATNFGLFLLGVITTTLIMANFLSGSLENKQVFAIITTDFLIVHPILLLLARFTNLSFQQRQIILEKEQAKQSALQHQLEALRSQINPHFLFNALNSLTVLIRNKSDRALPFVDQLSWLLRATLLRSEDDFITIQNELEYLESYIFLQKERFGEKFKVDVQIPENWKKELIPSFSLQLLAENAIKHNVVSTNQPLLLEIYPNGEYLIIRNQIHKRRDATEGTGLGLLNLSVRFKLLKKRDIQINQDENYFSVKLPILKNEGYNH
ncbi:MAG: histidine kinase [Lewinellaceae bacterium]|nr:histidine kinase [Lewinellaceae bacterium]